MKYIIEIEDEPFGRNDDPNIPHGMDELYRAKGFNSLVFDRNGLDKLIPLDTALDEAYQKGYEAGSHEATTIEYQKGFDDAKRISEEVCQLEYNKGLSDAWEAARKIVACSGANKPLDEMFGMHGIFDIINKFSASEALTKLKAYEQQKADEIKVGDEVKNTLDFMDNAVGYFFGDSSDGCYKVLRYVDGKFKTGIWNKGNCERTGKHSYAVERMVAVMEEGAECKD